jgi:uncharacterized protein (TIGR02266 family)
MVLSFLSTRDLRSARAASINSLTDELKLVIVGTEEIMRLEDSKNPARRENPSERRGHPRLPFLVLEVKGEKYNEVFLGYAQDLSLGGLYLKAANSFKKGERFPIEFVLPDNKTKIQCMGEVIWKTRFDQTNGLTEGVGLRFADLNSESREALDRWIEKRRGKTHKRR